MRPGEGRRLVGGIRGGEDRLKLSTVEMYLESTPTHNGGRDGQKGGKNSSLICPQGLNSHSIQFYLVLSPGRKKIHSITTYTIYI